MAKVFISHSSRDNDLAADIMKSLRERGFEDVFLDIDKHAGIPPGSDWERNLYRMIDSAHAVILVLTPNWHESKWCFFEFGQARALGKAIFPVVVAPTGDRYIARDIQYLDLLLDRDGGLDRLAKELTQIALDSQDWFKWDSSRAPYPGFLAFEKQDAAIFFGRNDDIARAIERLNVRRVQGGAKLVLLLGASGSGKSSLMRAGILPRLERDAGNWIIVPPFRPRRDPVGELAQAVCELLETHEDGQLWRERFASADVHKHLDAFVAQARLKAKAREAYVLITVDQGEELFAVADTEQVDTFFKLIETATAEAVPIVFLMALRSDYLDRFQRNCRAIRFDDVALGPFPLARVRQIIEGPARVAGIRIEEGLVTSAIVDMSVEDALPLLAFRLRDLYDRFVKPRGRQSGGLYDLTLSQYLSLGDPVAGLNPLENAVRERADQVLRDLALPDERLQALRQAFVGAMVRVDDAGQYVRRPALWDEIPKDEQPALEKFAQARLLVVRTEGGTTTVEVAHEALLRKWPQLRVWLDAERDFLVGKAQLRYALNDWQDAPADKKTSALLQGLALARARQWLGDHAHALAEHEQQYIAASIAADDRRERRQRQRRRLAWGTAMVLILLIVAATFLGQQGRLAGQRADAAALAIQARSSLADNPIRAAQLAAQAVEKNTSADTQSILLETVLALSPYLADVVRVPDLKPTSLAWSPREDAVAVGGWGALARWRPGAADRATAIGTVVIDKTATTDRMRSPVLAMAYAGAEIVAVTEDGRRVTIDADGAIGSEPLVNGVLAKAIFGADAASILAARRDEAEVILLRCRTPAAAAGACSPTTVSADYASAVALDSAHALAAIGRDDGVVRLVGLGDTPFNDEKSFGETIAALAFSRDGSRLAIGTTTGRIIVTDARGQTLAEAPASAGSVSALAFAPDGARLAAACGTSSVCLWQPTTSGGLKLLQRGEGHAEPISALAWKADGQQLASVADETVRIWAFDAPDQATQTLAADALAVLTDLAASSDQQWLAAGDATGHVYVWDRKTRALQPSPAGSGAEIRALAWSPRAPLLATAQSNGRVDLLAWPPDVAAKRLADNGDDLYALAWSADGTSVIAAGSNDGSIMMIPAVGGPVEALPRIHQDSVLALAVTRDGSRLLSSDATGKVWRWQLAARKPLDAAPLATGTSRDTLALSGDERRFLAAGNDGDVLVFASDQPPERNPPIRCRSGSRALDGAAFAADDRLIVALSDDAVLHLWSLADTCELLASAPLPSRARTGEPLYHRRHLISVAAAKAIAVTVSTNDVRLISTDMRSWLDRARRLSRFEP
jgi:WD40 repeat protein